MGGALLCYSTLRGVLRTLLRPCPPRVIKKAFKVINLYRLVQQADYRHVRPRLEIFARILPSTEKDVRPTWTITYSLLNLGEQRNLPDASMYKAF